jgi:RNA polymerase subunit RPABC4/transcription elongation factor Spt4
MTTQPFTRNHRDHSNDTGFQFEFFCDKCGNGHRSSFQTSGVGLAASMLKAAGSLFGGSVSRAGWGADHVKDALRGPAWDGAFQKAIEECRPQFRQCTLCGKWVCPEVCWNQARGLCEDCAPDLGEHAAQIQAKVAVEQAWTQAREANQMQNVDVKAPGVAVAAACKKCHAVLPTGSKFCAQCGTPSEVAGPKFCAQCGGQLAAGSKFCAQCGKPAA